MVILHSTIRNSPQVRARSSRLCRTSQSRMTRSSVGVTSSSAPSSWVQKTKMFMVPTLVNWRSGPYSQRTCSQPFFCASCCTNAVGA
uniref:Uncharacterized protein n=1 Tax=Rangifer tarandus platyrhynchus TaxID=3082113 RepID=A0ACB0E8G0_RANTA|nr:unnamed protein product [Rangifer tarandus platyrhynchus]